jgi:hypothetical protein
MACSGCHYWLIIVLAKMHGDLEVLKDKVKVLFELWNEKK